MMRMRRGGSASERAFRAISARQLSTSLLVQTYLGMEKPFDVNTAFSTKMLDTSVKMDASKVKK